MQLLFTLQTVASAITIAAAASPQPTPIPPPTGSYYVGERKLAVARTNPNNFTLPTNLISDFLATIFYPTKTEGRTAPYLESVTAQEWAQVYNISVDLLTSLTAKLAIDAPGLSNASQYPTVFFGPGGGGPPTEVYTTLLSDLASHGYNVIGIDDPHEQQYIRWPNGTGYYGSGAEDETTDETVYVRLAETTTMIDRLDLVEKALGTKVNRHLLGTFGHSAGGDAGLASMLYDRRILSSVNLDGPFQGGPFGEDGTTVPDFKRPVFLFGTGVHETTAVDPTWNETFPVNQTGYWREVVVKGSLHIDMSDITFWKDTAGVHSANLGPIDGRRMVNITRTWTRAFFDYTLLHCREAGKLFNGPSSDWPEVEFKAGSNGSHHHW
ncbi:hypothetical protein M409DRAFT_22830 [Zasmidium cellare ATCC 36951]|uniref:1-alkyl-2-acetylglycerophosphocholine esterase n=1 Tax=Zasmidium cellare ATCC 36951 TaxID=1080233 RepID=A0A6A6CMV2_ZASCE|nr:uncharacterized protein M409DRAFT_22830 [Zasmidium cellare ATCC 36951]KAF2166776.1 hypothetical protein M409DRAFT_22830 [Zasmidium cellare ATCC 36951]